MKNRKRLIDPVELTTVPILIVGILAAAAIPLMEGRTTEAKWSEAIVADLPQSRGLPL